MSCWQGEVVGFSNSWKSYVVLSFEVSAALMCYSHSKSQDSLERRRFPKYHPSVIACEISVWVVFFFSSVELQIYHWAALTPSR